MAEPALYRRDGTVPKRLPNAEYLHSILRYDPETGELFWKERPMGLFGSLREHNRWNGRYAGTRALNTRGTMDGYLSGRIKRSTCKAHRIIWALMTGADPLGFVDHINGVRTDNRWANLRAVTRFQNAQNVPRMRSNKSGVMGVRLAPYLRWQAYIRFEGKQRHLGYFDTFDDAVAARLKAEMDLGFHRNHGREQDA